MKLKHVFTIAAASLVLASPFAANAQTDQQMEAMFNKQAYMKMADANGMMSKAEVMKMVSDKIDSMAKNGMISVDDMRKVLNSLYRGGSPRRSAAQGPVFTANPARVVQLLQHRKNITTVR